MPALSICLAEVPLAESQQARLSPLTPWNPVLFSSVSLGTILFSVLGTVGMSNHPWCIHIVNLGVFVMCQKSEGTSAECRLFALEKL